MSASRKLSKGEMGAALERIEALEKAGRDAVSAEDGQWLVEQAGQDVKGLSADAQKVRASAVLLLREWEKPHPAPPPKLFSRSMVNDLERIDAVSVAGRDGASPADLAWVEAVAAVSDADLKGGSVTVRAAARILLDTWAKDALPPVPPRKSTIEFTAAISPRRSLKVVGSAACEAPKPRPIWQRASKVVPARQQWLWPGRFPRGTVSLIAGQKGEGKSTLLSAMMAVVTRGRPWPDSDAPNTPRSVVVLQDEESLATMLRPRLDRFGADLERIAFLTGVARGASEVEVGFSLMRDVDALEVVCDELGDVGMVMIDPIGSYMTGISGYCEGETREAIAPLFRFAERRNIAVIAIAHLNKCGDKGIDDRISGTFALPAKARMVWYLSRDPANRNRRLLTLLKGNLDDLTPTGLAFSYPKLQLMWHPKPVKLDARQVDNLLRRLALDERMGLRSTAPDRKSKLPAAKEVVLAILEAGPIAQAELLKRMAVCGVGESTYRKALAQLIRDDNRVVEDGDPPQLRLLPAPAPAPDPGPQPELPGLDAPAPAV